MVIQFFSLTLSSLLAISLLSSVVAAAIIPYVVRAYAHFVGGETKAIGNYKVQLLLSPSKPVVGNNSTKLNFSILNKDENKDIKPIFAALTIKEKNSGETVHQFPFKLYRFSDITIPYTFPNNTDYQLVLQTKISSDPRYENTPLVAVFDISAVNPIFSPGFDQFIIYYVIIPSATVAGIILGLILVTYKRKHIHHF
jgi:hypothetical protein